MYGEQHPSRVALRQAREMTIEQLSESFARDELSLEEFELRVDRAYAATEHGEVLALVSDLSTAHTPRMRVNVNQVPLSTVASANEQKTHVLARVEEPRAAVAIFGNVERHGRWSPAAKSRTLAVFGNAVLDLRAAVLDRDITEIEVKAVFGNVEIIVPPTLCVECQGSSIFGNFESLERVPSEPDGTPTLRVTGKAVFGNVEIRTQIRTDHQLLPR